MGSLVPCKTCKHQVDNTAKACPSCGVSNPGRTRSGFKVFIVITLCLLFGVAFLSENYFQDQKNKVEFLSSVVGYKENVYDVRQLESPFKRPELYLNSEITFATIMTGVRWGFPEDDVYRINYENDLAKMHVEAPAGMVSYLDIQFKQNHSCSQSDNFDPVPFIKALDINPAGLSPVSNNGYSHSFYDHKRKLKVGVLCPGDGMAITLYLSSKYYLN